jgi:N-methylhydantoinase A
LGAGATIDGPAIVEEAATTTVVLPGDRLEVHPSGALLIDIGGVR